MTRIRTRFAPSPTGPLHIGGVRTALYAYLFAKKNQGDFILRIEDTDTARTVAGSEELINESLQWCGIIPDEGVQQGGAYGPYKQSERKEIYKKHAEILLENGRAYYAFDTEEEIAAWREKTTIENNGIASAYGFQTRISMRNSLSLSKEEVQKLLEDNTPYVVRLKVDQTDDVQFDDIVRGSVQFKSAQLDDRVLLKSDGMPTYHLANVVDDHLMEITHVIRGEEWLASTPTHILLYHAFGWTKPVFAHLPLFLKPDGKGKLSKRDGDRLGFPVFCTQWINPETKEVSTGFREKGFESEALVNFLALLGWNDGTENEVFSMNELISAFSLERVHKAGAKFNYEKATWFNQQYILKMPTSRMASFVSNEIKSINPNVTDRFVEKYCELFKERIGFLYELANAGKYLYAPIDFYDKDTLDKKWNEQSAQFVQNFMVTLNLKSPISASDIELLTKEEIEKSGLSLGAILPVLRIGLTGITKGPSVFETIEILGNDESISRLEALRSIQRKAL
jgi:glutamyl-tRNA synthetase